MRIGIIGAGHVGQALGKGWLEAGHDVRYGVRDLDERPPHEGARVCSVSDAAAFAEVVVLATPWEAVGDAIAAMGLLTGKVLIDATNPIGAGFELVVGHDSSGAEQVASRASGARVVKAFNSTGFENMENPRYGDRRVVMPIAGDDAGAVEAVVTLARDLGFDAVPLQPLSRARELEPFALLWIKLAMAWGQGRAVAYGIARRGAADTKPPIARTKQPRTITVVGSGNIGGALARAWLAAGHSVRMSTRDPGAADVSALVALGATAHPVAEAAVGADVVVFAIPAGSVIETARAMGGLAGTIVVDCTNAITRGFTLRVGHTTSASEEVARALPGTKVVRAFNQQGAEVLANPSFGGRRATSFVAGDDPEARGIVADLSRDVGLDTVEAGPLASSRYLEPMTLLWIAMAQSVGTREIGLSLLRR